MSDRTPPWEWTGEDLDEMPRDTNPRHPQGKSCKAEWAGFADPQAPAWCCTMPPNHEPKPHRAGNGTEILAEWPAGGAR